LRLPRSGTIYRAFGRATNSQVHSSIPFSPETRLEFTYPIHSVVERPIRRSASSLRKKLEPLRYHSVNNRIAGHGGAFVSQRIPGVPKYSRIKPVCLMEKRQGFACKYEFLEPMILLILGDLSAAGFAWNGQTFGCFGILCRNDHKLAIRPFYGWIPKVVDSLGRENVRKESEACTCCS
jgi:hypothetical protein